MQFDVLLHALYRDGSSYASHIGRDSGRVVDVKIAKALEYFKKAGSWAFETASKSGVELVTASDAECDEQLHFGSLENPLRICETDFG